LNFGDGCPVFARHSRNYKPASFGFCAQRRSGQPELGGGDAEAQRLVIVDDDARFGLLDHSKILRRLASRCKRRGEFISAAAKAA
jgi:hypothetical protein